MARFIGRVGFAMYEEVDRIAREVYHEISYRGEYITSAVRWMDKQQINDDLTMENRISLIASGYLRKHLGAIRYVVIGEEKWKVTRVEMRHPRVILSIGGVYNT